MSGLDLDDRGSRWLHQAVFVTGNPNKVVEARRLSGVPLEVVRVELPEIQALDIDVVLLHKAGAARQVVDGAFVIEETGLELESMNGFPGALVKWMLEAVGAESMAKIAIDLGDRRVRARCSLHFECGDRTVVGTGVTAGTLALPPRGDQGFGWDPVFVPEGQTSSYAELRPAEKDAISHRGRAWRDLREKLAELPDP